MASAGIVGYAGTAIVVAAYAPQIAHLVREHCSAGISTRAYALWSLSSALFLIHASMIGDLVFIVVQIVSLVANSVIVACAQRYRFGTCGDHRSEYLARAGGGAGEIQ